MEEELLGSRGSSEEEETNALVRKRELSSNYKAGGFIYLRYSRATTYGWKGPYPILEVHPNKGTMLIKVADKFKTIKESGARPVEDSRVQWIGMTINGVPGSGEPPCQTTSDLRGKTGKPVFKQTWKSTMIWIAAVMILGMIGTVLAIQRKGELDATRKSYDHIELPQVTYEYPRYME